MADKRAKEIIDLESRERGSTESSNFRTLWQDTADLEFPRNNNIVDRSTPGENKTNRLTDVTAIMESQNMASGMAQNLVPAGQKFHAITSNNREIRKTDIAKRYFGNATEIVHDELFSSNFMLQLTETLRSLVVFGTGNLFSEYTTKLNFKDYAIGTYQILQNSEGLVDTMILKFQLTARQAKQEFSEVTKSIEEAMRTPEGENTKFWFIHVVRPRKDRNPNLSDNLNMPFESLFVTVQDVEIIDEGGFESFPYHVPRWLKASNEKYGRGQGTEILPQVRVLNTMVGDFVELGNKWVNPPLEVLESFEGEVSVIPGATNFVTEKNTIAAIQQNALGNFPVGKDIIEMQRQIIKDAFFSNAFAPLTDLTGDRRTTLEIRQRVQESFKKIGSPIGRIQTELFTPMIERVFNLLLQNGRIPPPPPEIAAGGFKGEYVGPLSLALKSSEVEAAQQWTAIIAEISQIEEGAVDHIDFDDMIPRMARTFGVNEEDIASKEQVEAKREARRVIREQQLALQAAQTAGQANQGLSKAPEEGSPAEALLNA